MPIKIGIVDDHLLFLESLVSLLESNGKFCVILKALNGKDLQSKMTGDNSPDIMLIDVNMPHMDGFETSTWLKENYPNLKLVALSMKDDEQTIIRMLKSGCCSYFLKDIHPDELENALEMIYVHGFYNGDASSANITKLLVTKEENDAIKINERELEFLKLACSDITYKAIADNMNLSERIVDKIRDHLFTKFKVQSRVGLCMEAIRREFVRL